MISSLIVFHKHGLLSSKPFIFIKVFSGLLNWKFSFSIQYIYFIKALAYETIFDMGNSCGSGIEHSQYDFNYFINKYGRDTMLNITKDNLRKEEIFKKMPQITSMYQKSIHQSKISSVRQMNVYQANIINQIEEKIKEIQKKDTGQVHKAEQKYDQPAEDLLGREQIRKDCTQLRNKILTVYEDEEKRTRNKIQNDFQAYLSDLEKERKQKFAQIQMLSEENRQFIRKQARKKFKKEIQAYRQQVAQQIEQGKVIDMVGLRQDYNHLHPHEQIQELKKKHETLINKGQKIILGVDIFGVNSKEILPSPGFWKCC